MITIYPADLETLVAQQRRASAEVEDKTSGVNNHASTMVPASRKMRVTNEKKTRVWSKGSKYAGAKLRCVPPGVQNHEWTKGRPKLARDQPDTGKTALRGRFL